MLSDILSAHNKNTTGGEQAMAKNEKQQKKRKGHSVQDLIGIAHLFQRWNKNRNKDVKKYNIII